MTLTDYHILILCLLLCMGAVAVLNIFTFGRIRPSQKPQSSRMVSVLIPARNEAQNIGVCLSGLAGQDYPKYEIIVLDDNSDDGTASIVEQWERSDSRVRLVRGVPLPPGWVGKCFACHQLAQQAQGELLLFTDADTEHSRFSISAAVAAMERSQADLLTVIPFLKLKTFWEKTIMPMLHFTTFCFLPFPLVSASRNPKFAMANGQFMLFKRSVYDAIGGHEAVKDALVEDVWLSRLVKKRGYQLRIMDGVRIVSSRMYRSFNQIWQGFSKNFFPGFKYSLGTISAVIFFNVVTSIAPFGFLAMSLFASETFEWTPIVASQVSIILAIRLLMAHRFKMNLPATLLHPLGMAVVAGIAVNSARWALWSGGLRWKGRTYDFRSENAV
ncbi:glycosyltransferase [Sphingobacteriales bacterium CHB3]|nr:glycosyltransferase [Sphingobacteriales bacterium CHB3]